MRSRPPRQLSWLNTFLQPTHCPIKSAVLRDDDCVALTGSITGSSLPRDPSPVCVCVWKGCGTTPCCTALLPPTRPRQSTWLLISGIMPFCTWVYVWMNISSADPPLGGKGCFWSMALRNPALNEGWGGEDKHSWTMRASFTPCCTHTHLKSAYPQCNTWVKSILPHTGSNAVPLQNNIPPSPKSHKCQLWLRYNPSGPLLSILYPIQLVLIYFNKTCFWLILPWNR